MNDVADSSQNNARGVNARRTETIGGPSRSGSAARVDPIGTARLPWTRWALCAQTDPDMFFSDSTSQTEQAKTICSQCPVRFECLCSSLEAREEFGVWGGLDRDERRRLLRGNRTTPPRSPDAA